MADKAPNGGAARSGQEEASSELAAIVARLETRLAALEQQSHRLRAAARAHNLPQLEAALRDLVAGEPEG